MQTLSDFSVKHLTPRQPSYSGDFLFTINKQLFSLELNKSDEKVSSLHFRENGRYKGSFYAEANTENLIFAQAEGNNQEISLEVQQKAHSQLTLVLHLSLLQKGNISININTKQAEYSRFHLVILQNSEGDSHIQVQSMLEERSHADLHLLSVQKNDSKASLSAEIQASSPGCSGSIRERAVLFDHSVCSMQGNPHIFPGATFSDLELEQKTLLIGEDSRVISKPQLFVSNNEVQAKHSASIATLSEEDRFYLMSRGLNEENAKQLMIDAFIHSLFEKIPSENIRNCLIENLKKFILE